ncbi:MAG: hypothetical protein ACREUU_09405 [Gammaproteobacteria bacterium]
MQPQVVPDYDQFRNTIVPVPVPTKGQLDFKPSLLPRGARGKFSSFDGDAFVIHFPPRESGSLTAQQVFTDTIQPLVNAMGYGTRAGDLTPGSPAGKTLPRANLSALATETCKEVEGERYQRFHPVCQALVRGESNPIAERVLQLAYGMSVAQFRADIERPRIHYTFSQRAANVPIEHVGIVAERNDGETITAVYGTLLNRYGITNSVKLTPDAAVEAGQAQVLKFKGIAERVPQVRRPQAVLVLLPYGTAPDGSTGLRYAYRTLLFANIAGAPGAGFLSWMAWIDAGDGNLLQLAPQFDEVSAVGLTWRRDPNTPTQARSFQVDTSSGGQYTLQRSGVFNRIDRFGDSAFDDGEVSISDSMSGSSATFANFNQATINDAANAICAAGGNNTFRQVNAFAHLSSFRDTLVSAGTFPTFPENPVTVWIDLPQTSNSAPYDQLGIGLSVINLGTGLAGFTDPACPDLAGGVLPGSSDATPLAHEFMHIGTKRLQERRPADWCGMAPCAMPSPTPRQSFHDYTDSWAHAYASTPCMGGWYRKNMGGPDASENCLTHNEAGGLPRLASVSEPFNTATILDHFPERRATLTGGYEDMHIIGAALWLTRQGMRSKCLPSGTPQFWVRINRALYNSGFITGTCAACDRDIYRYAQNFLQQLAQQWATAGMPGGPPGFAHNGAHTTNKLLSGWARAGIFLSPYTCIDGDAATGDPTFCPVASGGENGGDAIGDVFDNDPGDDVVIDQITHVEMDWIQRGDPPPTFRVWTGPRYKFDAAGSSSGYTPSMATPSPCNTKFRVELASDDAFTVNVVNGLWTNVSTTAQPECYGTWSPNAADWTTLSGTTGDVKVYYRVRTRDAADMNEKLSTLPGSGSYTVPPSYVVVNDAGQP